MRLFIAFDVSDEVKNYCRQIQKILPDSNSKLVEDFHLTLRFLGEYDENETKELISNFSKIKFKKFVAKTNSLGVFPNENFIKVIWLGLEPKDKIKKLKEQIEKALKLTKDKRFHPHITLARIKFIKNKREYMQRLKSIDTKELKFDVKSIKLYKSTLTPKGSVHEVIETALS